VDVRRIYRGLGAEARQVLPVGRTPCDVGRRERQRDVQGPGKGNNILKRCTVAVLVGFDTGRTYIDVNRQSVLPVRGCSTTASILVTRRNPA
jgi:hypothetical protein